VQSVTAGDLSHPFKEINRYSPICNKELKLYEALRESVPIIDAAIFKIIRLVGGFAAVCEDRITENKLNDFLMNVQVNSCELGAESFIGTYLEQLLTYGTAVGEIVLDSTCTGITALYNVPLENVELHVDNSPLNLKIYRREISGKITPVKFQNLILTSALNPTPGNIFGNSLLKGLPFVSGILLNIYNSIGLNWERLGNIRFAITYKPNSNTGEQSFTKERVMQIASEWQKAMRNTGNISDFISVGDVNIKVIGADNQVLNSEIPVRQMLEQIIAKLSIPPFLLGLSWSTSERMSKQQADILTSELESYRRLLTPIIKKICILFLKLNGIFQDFKIIWENINLQDEVELAHARLISARAQEIEKRL